MKITKKIGLLFLAVLIFSGVCLFRFQPSKAQNVEPAASDSPASFDDAGKNFSNLLAVAQEKGSVRVIIGLKLASRSEGDLSLPERLQQRTSIKQIQNEFLERFKSYSVREIKQFDYIPFLALETDAAALQEMEKDAQIISIFEDAAVPPTLAESVPLIGAPSAWSAGYSGSGWSVAVLDTGVDKTHSFLSGKVISEACYSTNSSNASSVCPQGVTATTAANSGLNCSTSITGCDHGTHVAGIAAGRGTSFSGVAKDASIIAIQVFSRFNSASDCKTLAAPCALTFSSDQVKGLERVLALSGSTNIASVNMSLGGDKFTSNCDANNPALKSAIDNLRSVGIATVIASGNDGFTNAISSPGCISSAVSVGSTGDGSGGATVDAVSSFSNSASFLNLLAPGSVINSSVPGNTFANFNGTSMATPHVAGAWAILKQRVPNASVTQILSALSSTGQPITDARNGIVKPRIRVNNALQALAGNCSYTISPAASPVLPAAGGNGSFTVTAASGCAWTTTNSASSWITITSGAGGGSGNGTVSYTAAANTGASQRTATINVSGQVHTVTQAGTGGGTCSAAQISFGQTVNGSLASSDCVFTGTTKYVDVYTFSGTSGQQISVSMNSTAFDAYLFLVDSNNQVIYEDDDGGAAGTDSRIPTDSGFFTLPATGTYRIWASSFDAGSVGAYSINLTQNGGGCPATPISFGQTINGSLTASDCFFTGTTKYLDIYTFNGTAGQNISVVMNSAVFDAYLYLVTSANQLISEDDDGNGGTNSRIPTNAGFITLPATGTYSIYASSFSAGSIGAYSISLTQNGSSATHNRKTAGVFRPSNGITYMRNSNTGGVADISMIYGVAGDQSFAGDWNGDRVDSIGIYRNGVFYLRNSNTTGPADIVFAFGSPGDQPIAGDWNGDGIDTIGVYRPSTGVFMLRNSNSAGAPDVTFVLGNPGDVAIAGDWNGDGITTTGVFRPTNGIVYLKNTNQSGNADIYLVYGVAGDKPLAGDWDGDGIDSIGIYRGGVFYLRNSNTQGVADLVFALGNPGDEPIAGDWDGQP